MKDEAFDSNGHIHCFPRCPPGFLKLNMEKTHLMWQIIKHLLCLMPQSLPGRKISFFTLCSLQDLNLQIFPFSPSQISVSSHFYSPFVKVGTFCIQISNLVSQRQLCFPSISRKFYVSKPFLFCFLIGSFLFSAEPFFSQHKHDST